MEGTSIMLYLKVKKYLSAECQKYFTNCIESWIKQPGKS